MAGRRALLSAPLRARIIQGGNLGNDRANLGGDGKAGGEVLNAIKKNWGGYEPWEAEFEQTGNALGGGSAG